MDLFLKTLKDKSGLWDGGGLEFKTWKNRRKSLLMSIFGGLFFVLNDSMKAV